MLGGIWVRFMGDLKAVEVILDQVFPSMKHQNLRLNIRENDENTRFVCPWAAAG
jgi:hypothetical protein